LIVVGYTGTSTVSKLYRNNEATVNITSTSPTVLTSNSTGGKLVLSLNEGSDYSTPSVSLTYNIRVGTTSGGNQIFSGVNPVIFGRNWVANFG
jgi:hypothetical protein